MEFLKSCTTGVHSVVSLLKLLVMEIASNLLQSGFSTILYRIYTADVAPTSTSTSNSSKLSKHDVLDIIQSSVQGDGIFAAADKEEDVVWLFQNKLDGQPIAQLPEETPSPKVDGFSLQLITQGLFKAAELPRARLRAVTEARSPLTPPPSESAAALRTLLSNAKAFQANAQATNPSDVPKPSTDISPLAMYPWFMSAVELAVSRHVASNYGLVPLNARTFIVPETHRQASEYPSDDDDNSLDGLEMISLSSYLTSGGILVLSFSSTWRWDIHQLSVADELNSNKLPIVRISPCGMLAKVNGLEGAVNGSTRNDQRRPTQKKVKPSGNIFQDSQWKDTVKSWLARRGLDLNSLDMPGKWVQIQFSQDAPFVVAESNEHSSQAVVCLWPACLCFAVTPNAATVPLDSRQSLQWFSESDAEGYADPLSEAQAWFAGEAERQKTKEAKKQSQFAIQEPANVQDPTPLFPASPFYARADLQAASGVYPTPPDAILTQPSTALSVPDVPLGVPNTAEGPQSNEELADLGNLPTVTEEVEELNDIEASPLDGGNDLFGDMDMDDDNFGGNELSEADFNFFDEPGADVNMEDTQIPDMEPDGQSEDPVVATAALTDAEPSKAEIGEPAIKDEAMSFADQTSADGLILESPTADPVLPSSLENAKVGSTLMDRIVETPAQPGASPQANAAPSRKQLIGKSTSNQPNASSGALKDTRREKMYDVVRFVHNVIGTDSKYSSGGVFGFQSTGHRHQAQGQPSGKTLYGFTASPTRPSGPGFGVQQVLPSAGSKLLRSDMLKPRNKYSLTDAGPVADVSEDSESSDDDSFEPVEEYGQWDKQEITEAIVEPPKRKRPRLDDGISAVSTPTTVSTEDQKLPRLQNLALNVSTDDVLDTLDADFADWDIARVPFLHGMTISSGPETPSSAGPLISPASKPSQASTLKAKGQDLSRRDSIAVAQLVADQVALSTLMLVPTTDDGIKDDGSSMDDGEEVARPSALTRNIVADLFPDATLNDLIKYAQIPDAPFEPPPGAKVPPKPPQRRMTGASQPDPNAISGQIYPIAPPRVRVRRGDSLWDLLPTSLAFWEPLGLAPTSGSKNILSYCIYPPNEDLVDPLESFFDCLGSVYDSGKLGTHLPGTPVGEYESNLMPLALPDADPPTVDSALRALREICEELGHLLAAADLSTAEKTLRELSQSRNDETPPTIGSFVIYIVNPFESASSLKDICTCFWSMFQAYETASRKRSPLDKRPDLVLQILPIKYVASASAPIVPQPQFLATFAREVYDRCPPSSTGEKKQSLSIAAAPSIQLEEQVPRTILFKLVADPQGDLLPDAVHLHLGYATSWNSDWLAAAWIDSTGKYQALVSYYLRGRSFADVAFEIWQTTISIIQARKMTWRVTIARAGVMERDELEGEMFRWDRFSPTRLLTEPCSLDADHSGPRSGSHWDHSCLCGHRAFSLVDATSSIIFASTY